MRYEGGKMVKYDGKDARRCRTGVSVSMSPRSKQRPKGERWHYYQSWTTPREMEDIRSRSTRAGARSVSRAASCVQECNDNILRTIEGMNIHSASPPSPAQPQYPCAST